MTHNFQIILFTQETYANIMQQMKACLPENINFSSRYQMKKKRLLIYD